MSSEVLDNNWKIYKIRELCIGIYDGPHATPKKTNSGPIFLGISNLSHGSLDLSETEHLSEQDFLGWTKRIEPGPNDIVFSYETRLGEVAIIPEGLKCCLGRRMGLMRPDTSKVDPRFLLYAYLSPEFQETIRERTVHGSTVDRISLIEFPEYPLRVPSLIEQRAIARILGSLDDKIEANRRMNETMEAMARAIFKSWFVDFDPVRAKSEGREPAGMDAETTALFPDSFEETELGMVPKGWEIVSLPKIIDVNPPRSLRKSAVASYLDMANMPSQGHVPEAVTLRPFGSGMRFINGDTLVARITPCLENGKTAYVDFLKSGEVGWGSTEYIVLRPKPPLPTEFAYCLARSQEFRVFAIQSMTGTSGRQRVPAQALSHYSIVSPPPMISEHFGHLVSPIFARARKAMIESRTLAALRDTLLPRFISGTIRVEDAEEFLKVRNS